MSNQLDAYSPEIQRRGLDRILADIADFPDDFDEAFFGAKYFLAKPLYLAKPVGYDGNHEDQGTNYRGGKGWTGKEGD